MLIQPYADQFYIVEIEKQTKNKQLLTVRQTQIIIHHGILKVTSKQRGMREY